MSKETGSTENLPPSALYTAQDRKLIEILTGDTPDCRPKPAQTSPALGWSVTAVKPRGKGRSAGWRRGQTSDQKVLKCKSKHHFLRSCLKIKTIWKTFLQE